MYLLLGMSLGLTFYILANAVLSGVAAAVGCSSAARMESPVRRARALLLWRLFPSIAAAVFVLGLFAPSYACLEQPTSSETPSVFLLALAALALLLVAAGLARCLSAVNRGSHLAAAWLSRATPVPHEEVGVFHRVEGCFPPACVVGVVRPTFIVSKATFEALSPGELRAVLAHEAAHARRHDNLTRLLFRGVPDVLGLLPAGRRIEREWERASEFAADRLAAAGSPARALDLSAALIAVARLLPEGGVRPALFAAIHGTEDVTDRVAALLSIRGPEAPSGPSLGFLLPIGLALGLLLLAVPSALALIHEFTETLVHFLS
jgi:Zn-dependent protease with chaperone function